MLLNTLSPALMVIYLTEFFFSKAASPKYSPAFIVLIFLLFLNTSTEPYHYYYEIKNILFLN